MSGTIPSLNGEPSFSLESFDPDGIGSALFSILTEVACFKRVLGFSR